ncbi:nitroreductase family deazaflavin-dependent oxidoreductase [Segniliparus rugosus]|uniref:Deazaflavin-dependent nitroreductase n=1 Tax=Segniliparus rugosus (strain ATCC BAA-974 / DSM 45345 / CCUG 50838 / CIP 108380 / JCM 13579 / CDC 945) TaxID=679197 RepID=E5XQ38_SEGRC|nr:nitroreductase family deazaflavin-dependent oxidoreductase [Segniliparus rugosus]EFV13547.1 deazaflavin-dependent nitroreductase [Segniliparus rugosus ATCC BAA-974]
MEQHTANARRMFRVIRAVGRYALNPSARFFAKLGLVPTSQVAELETIGRKTGQLRRVPVSPIFDETGAWVICGHGTLSGWGSNISANPNVRIQQGKRWRAGVASFVPDDDIRARVRQASTFGPRIASYGTAPVTVRIDFTDGEPRRG